MLLSLIKKDLLLTWKYILLMAALCCFYPLFILHNPHATDKTTEHFVAFHLGICMVHTCM